MPRRLRRSSLAPRSLINLFGTSALYHRVNWSTDARKRMRRLDHAAIFILIAGGYTPIFALIPFITRLPTLPDTPGRRLRMRIGDAVFVVVALFSVLQAVYEPLLGQSWTALDNATNFASLIVLGFAVVAYLDASGEGRRRIAWVIAGIVVSVSRRPRSTPSIPSFRSRTKCI